MSESGNDQDSHISGVALEPKGAQELETVTSLGLFLTPNYKHMFTFHCRRSGGPILATADNAFCASHIVWGGVQVRYASTPAEQPKYTAGGH